MQKTNAGRKTRDMRSHQPQRKQDHWCTDGKLKGLGLEQTTNMMNTTNRLQCVSKSTEVEDEGATKMEEMTQKLKEAGKRIKKHM